MILKLLLNILVIWIIFIKRLENTTQKKRKILIVFHNVIANIHSNKKLK